MSANSSGFRAVTSTGFGAGVNAAEAINIIAQWQARARQRRQLARLDATQLADIGISHEVARTEASKPFWQR